MSSFFFADLESVERIIHEPLSDTYATLLPRGDGLWESTYSLLSLPSSRDMNVACFDGSAREGLTISVIHVSIEVIASSTVLSSNLTL